MSRKFFDKLIDIDLVKGARNTQSVANNYMYLQSVYLKLLQKFKN